MPRRARKQGQSEIYHLIQRGLNKNKIFSEEEDKEFLLNALKERIGKYYIKIYAYIVMDNHYHLLAQFNLPNLSRFMMSLNTTYAKYWAKKEGWVGYVYQDRFKSIRITAEEQLLQTIRYVHLNRARISEKENIEKYLFSGHIEIIGKKNRDIVDIESVLRLFGEDEKSSIKTYKYFINEGLKQNTSKIQKIVYQEIPTAETQKKILAEKRVSEHLGSEIEQHKWVYESERRKGKIKSKRKSDLLKIIAQIEGINPEELRSKGLKKPPTVEGKRLMCFVGRTYLDFQLRKLADYLGLHEKTLLQGVKEIEDKVRKNDETILSKINRILIELEVLPKRVK